MCAKISQHVVTKESRGGERGGGSHMRMIKQSLEYYVAIMNHLCQVFFVVDVFNVGQA